MINIAINGFGRIGRNIVRAFFEGGYQSNFNIVAINDLADADINSHLLEFDTTHGRFNYKVDSSENSITIDGIEIPVFMERDPSNLPWKELNVDVVFECTGYFRTRETASLHLQAGAKKVLVSAPGKGLDATVVYGVNHEQIKSDDRLVSNGSCSTNCLAHVAKAMNDEFGIESGLANTIHAYTNTQNLLDSFHKDKRRARAANYSMIPTTTGSAKAIGAVIPELDGKLDALSVRVPTINVSLLDFTFYTQNTANIDRIYEVFQKYESSREGIFHISNKPLVSTDYNHSPESCIVDSDQTRVNGKLVKVLAWYDNEWAFSNRMFDTATVMSE